MHVLIIPTEPYLYCHSLLGGIFQHHLALALNRANCKVGIISPCIEPFTKIYEIFNKHGIEIGSDHEIPVYRYYGYNLFPKVNRGTYWSWLRAGIVLIDRYISDHGIPDIIHAHNIVFAGMLAAKIKKKYRIPYIITEHSSEYARGLYQQSLVPVIRSVLADASIKTVVSGKLGELLFNLFGSCATPYYPIYNILDNTFAHPFNQLKKISDKTVFLNIAGLDPNKDHVSLLQGFADAFKGNYDVQLRIGGDGALKGMLQQKAKDLGIQEQVIFLGLLSREEVLEENLNCDVFVLTSKYETFGVVLIEALACGKPIVSTACGGPEDIVNDTNGILVPTKDVKSLSEAMKKMKIDYSKYNPNRIREDCLARYGEKVFIDIILELYSKALPSKHALQPL